MEATGIGIQYSSITEWKFYFQKKAIVGGMKVSDGREISLLRENLGIKQHS